MMRRILPPFLMLMLALALVVSTASATSLAAQVDLVPGNYCISCHLKDDTRLAPVTEWVGSIGREINNPCPAATKVHEELYYTERMLLMIDHARGTAGVLPEKTRLQLDGYTQAYSRQLDGPVTSLEAFSAEAQTTRYRLNKVYSVLNQMVETAKKRTVLLYASAVTLIVLGSMAWGLFNTRAFRTTSARRTKGMIGGGIFLLAVFAFFVLPIFRVPAAEVVTTTAAAQEAQAILDAADRAATAADRAQARAWMLARLGTAWNETSPAQARAMLEDAQASVRQAYDNEDALWGQSLSVQEANIGPAIDLEKADIIATDLNAARARPWGVPLIAAEWNAVDPARAKSLLQAEQDALATQTGIYRDLQLRALALAWTGIEPLKAVSSAQEIDDPSVRSWTLREIGVLTRDQSVFGTAAEAARRVNDPVQQARALRELAVISGDNAFFAEALAALGGSSGAPLAYALSDLAAASGDLSLAARIDPAYPDARTAAFLRLGEYEAAWNAAAAIVDPYEQARAQAAIAGAWANPDAMQIEIPLYRDLALRDVIRETNDVTLAGSIQSAYYKVQALTALGDYQNAIQAAGGLVDSYPLVALSAALAEEDPQAAVLLVEKMTRESDKATALKTIAAAGGNQELFEQAKGMALAARVRGDSLAPVQASLDLANAMWQTNAANALSALRQACDAAEKISTK